MFVWYSGKRFQSETPMSLDSTVRLATTSAITHHNSRILMSRRSFYSQALPKGLYKWNSRGIRSASKHSSQNNFDVISALLTVISAGV